MAKLLRIYSIIGVFVKLQFEFYFYNLRKLRQLRRMLELQEPISVSFRIPATDPLGRNEVIGKLRFLPQHCELHWHLEHNVFRGGKGEHHIVNIPYGEIEEVDLKKRWLGRSTISFNISNPKLILNMPGVEMGKLTFEIDKKSSSSLGKLKNYVDFKKSVFQFEKTDTYLKNMIHYLQFQQSRHFNLITSQD